MGEGGGIGWGGVEGWGENADNCNNSNTNLIKHNHNITVTSNKIIIIS